MKDELLTGNQAADFLGVHRQTFKNWRKAGRVTPAQESNNLTLYSRKYLERVKAETAERGETRGRKKTSEISSVST